MATITGTDAGETLTGTNQADRISGVGGADWLSGLGGDDELDGGAGADLLDGGAGFNTASYRASAAGVTVRLDLGLGQGGEAAGDVLLGIEGVIGSAHADLLVGTDVRNLLRGGGGGDSLVGAGGDDELEGGAGGDGLFGDAGFDTASYAGSTAGVLVILGDSRFVRDGDATGDTLFSIEGLRGSAFADILGGDDLRNVLRGGSGNDSLGGFGGEDALFSDAGNDNLDGGAGNDLLDGGAGNDNLEGDPGNDELRGGAGSDTASFFDDFSTAGVRADLASGVASGVDIGNDRLFGIENLTGGRHNDLLFGNDGANVLTGDGDGDTLTGRGGADRFNYDYVDQSRPNAPDLIQDFNRAQGDRIDLAGIDARIGATGNQAFTFIGQGPFTGEGQLRYHREFGVTYVEANTGATTAGPELVIVLNGLFTLQTGDFVL
jgi:Ca2+-binding RTX toxin-like protein